MALECQIAPLPIGPDPSAAGNLTSAQTPGRWPSHRGKQPHYFMCLYSLLHPCYVSITQKEIEDMAKVNLDAIIPREDFEAEESLISGKKKETLSIEDIKAD